MVPQSALSLVIFSHNVTFAEAMQRVAEHAPKFFMLSAVSRPAGLRALAPLHWHDATLSRASSRRSHAPSTSGAAPMVGLAPRRAVHAAD